MYQRSERASLNRLVMLRLINMILSFGPFQTMTAKSYQQGFSLLAHTSIIIQTVTVKYNWTPLILLMSWQSPFIPKMMFLHRSQWGMLATTLFENSMHIFTRRPYTSHFTDEVTAECSLLAPTVVKHSLDIWAGGRVLHMVFEPDIYKIMQNTILDTHIWHFSRFIQWSIRTAGKYPTRNTKKDLHYTYWQDRHNHWLWSKSTCCHTVGFGEGNRKWGHVAAHVYSIYLFEGLLLEYNWWKTD